MRKIYFLFLFAGLAAIVGISGCDIINPSEPVPTYVHIDSFAFTGDARYGSASHRITNVYVYFNNAPVGIFDLPVTFPVLASAPGTLTVLPGIDFSGLSGYEIVYPFYTAGILNLTPAPGSVVNYTPSIRYDTSAAIRFSENFDEPVTTSFVKLSGDTSIGRTTGEDAFEGGGSGIISLPAGKDSATIISSAITDLPINGEVYLELDYKSNVPVQIGMSALLTNGSTYVEYLPVGLKDKSEWGKIYYGLRDFISAHQGPEYKILIRAYKFGVTDARVYLDNIKVVSFK